MTRYRLDHAVVMDTDDIPGRGGYAVVGLSPGVAAAERLFVAQNFGIGDFLHDPQNDRTFYSFFRVPGGRRAFTRRFANGKRRNGTQNRLFVHTLFFDDALFAGLAGLPWLLLEGNVRAEGSSDWQPLRNEVPWVSADGSLPMLEAEVDEHVIDDLPRRLNARLGLAGKDLADPRAAAASVIGALRDQSRAVLPQGRGYEWLTLLAWSMLPPRDREELAWTQHDTLNISGVTFQIANALAPTNESVALERPPAPIAVRIVERNTGTSEEWREFHETAARYALSIRRAEGLEACLAHRDAIRQVRENIGQPDEELVKRLTTLAATADGLRGEPCFEGEGMLELLWQNIPRAVAANNPADVAVPRWAVLMQRSGLSRALFREAPDRRWLDRAAADVGPDLVVDFFLRATEGIGEAAATRVAVVDWVVANGAGVESESLARLIVRAYADRAGKRRELLARIESLDALAAVIPARAEMAELIYDATSLAVERRSDDGKTFLREVLVPRIDEVGPKLSAELAERIAPLLRDDERAFVAFLRPLDPAIRASLAETVARWLHEDPQRILLLARAVMTVAPAASLALGLARAGAEARLWFRPLLQLAETHDARDDARATKSFLEDLQRLQPRSVEGVLSPLMDALDQPNARAGACTRALLLVARPAWESRLVPIVTRVIGRTYSSVAGWAPVVNGIAADFSGPDVAELIAQFWQKVPPEDVPNLPAATVDALAHVSGTARKRLLDTWMPRVRHLPKSASSDRLLQILFGKVDAAAARELRVRLALREIEQGTPDESTWNRLDVALHDLHGAKYAPELAAALTRFAGEARVPRIRKLCVMLASPKLLPTVKRIIEADVLPRALKTMVDDDWNELLTKAREEELFCRGAATLTIAYDLGAHANDDAVRQFESACRARRRSDAAHSLAAGRRSRGLGRRIGRWLGLDRQPSA